MKKTEAVLHIRLPRQLYEGMVERAGEIGLKHSNVVRLLIADFVTGKLTIQASTAQPNNPDLEEMLK